MINTTTRPVSPTSWPRLETDDDREWNSLHLTYEDAERQLKAVGAAWGVGFTLDGEPANGFRRYDIAQLPVLGPEESGQAPEESLTCHAHRRGDGHLDVAD